MKVGYFCYRLSGTGPRTRAADIINGIAASGDEEVVVLTNEPEKITADADVRHISLSDLGRTLLTTRRAFADADVVHVPINVYQVLFVRLVYYGPLVAGVGPGIQPTPFHRYLGRLLGIDVKVKGLEIDEKWDRAGYETVVCSATIDRDQFYPYDDERIRELRHQHGIDDDETVVLYVGTLNEGQGAHLVSEMARLAADDDTYRFIVAGSGPLEDRFRDREDLTFAGFVDNKELPEYYNLADVTVAPRKEDKTSNVGLESIACGTPMITTASGKIERVFRDRGTYVWAERTPEAVLETVRELVEDREYYAAQRRRGLETMEEMDLTLDRALTIHRDVYRSLGRTVE
ncbi:glycosyltransferase [Halosimplex sp. J119]